MPSSRKRKQGKVKIGRENEREPVQASSNQLSAKRLMSIWKPYVKSEFQTSLGAHHRLRGYSRLPTRRISPMRKRKTPMRSEQSSEKEAWAGPPTRNPASRTKARNGFAFIPISPCVRLTLRPPRGPGSCRNPRRLMREIPTYSPRPGSKSVL